MEKSIRVGILFSLSGTMEISEKGQCYAALLAIEEINRSGGVNGRKLRPLVADTASNPYIAAKEAEKLIVEHKVVAIIGLYTSATRKEVIPIIEKYNSVLFYPNGYEGEEQHPNVIYCGPLPTQNLIHFIPWITKTIGKKFYLIGSDYIYPKEMNMHITSLVPANQGKILGEEYTPLGKQKFEENIKKIQQVNPDIVFSTLVGNSAVSFYKQYYEAGIQKPIASLITAETEIAAINLNPKYTTGHFACFPYFNSIETKENKLFLKSFKDLYDTDTVSSVMENAYNSVYLFMEAVKKCETIDTSSILFHVKGVRFHAPQGEIMVDKENQHVWLNSRIGKVNKSGTFDILWKSEHLFQPIPFAKYYLSDKKIGDKSLDKLDEELQVKLRNHQPLMNELKKATADLTDPIVFFDKEGQLLSILHGQKIVSKNLPFLLMGISAWRTPALRNSGIAHCLTSATPSYISMEEHMDKQMNKWISIGIPIKDKNESLIGCLGVLSTRKNQSSVTLLVSLLSKITSYCVQLLENSNHYIFTYELLNNFSSYLDEPLFIFHKQSFCFESNLAKQLRSNNYDFILEYINGIVGNVTEKKVSKVVHQKSTNELFEITITKKGNYDYVTVKEISQNTNMKQATLLNDNDLIGTNNKFLKSLYLAKTASKSDVCVLLQGENGTGKEQFAREIHMKSQRKDKPFIILNFTATPAHLMYIELFGYEEGTFPDGDKQASPGKFELAEGGTLFLDEISDMSPDLQTTLLRVIQEKKVTRVGGHKSIPINVRIIAATKKNIQQEVAYKGSFKSDLYFLLSTCTIELLPLRDRKDDIPHLIQYFINKLSSESGKRKKEIHTDTLYFLMEYNWPGNIRELRDLIERAFHLSGDAHEISVQHLPNYIFENSQEFEEAAMKRTQQWIYNKEIESEKLHKKQFEEFNIIEAIIKFKGNITNTAKYLGMSRTTLYRKLEEINANRQL